MKKVKKSEIAIYVIALMLVTAGYFNYTAFEKNAEETYLSDVSNEVEEYANTGDAVLVSNQETEEVLPNSEKKDDEDKETSNEIQNNEEESKETSNDVQNNEENSQSEPTSTENINDEDYYSTSKLERNKMFAEMISNYENIISNTNSSEVQKSIATEEIKKINNNKNAIMICENLISTKGFKNCVIFINDESVNIVVRIEGGLNTEKVAIIQNIISRELNTKIENIHITEK